MNLILLDKKGLEDYLKSPFFKSGSDIAISWQRAISQMSNPRQEEGDVILILAIEDQNLLGYAGTLPDHVFCGEEKVRFAWFSCFWVRKDSRNKGIGKLLLNKALEVWKGHLMLTDFVPETKRFYQSTGQFDQIHHQQGFRWYFKSELAFWLPPKYSFFGKIKPVLHVLDKVLNLVFSPSKPQSMRQNIQAKPLTHLAPEDDAFLFSNSMDNSFRHSHREWNWVKTYPWILEGEMEPDDYRYYFSSRAVQFSCEIFEIRKGNWKSLLILSVRNGVLKIPFVAFEKGAESAVAAFLKTYCLEKKVAVFVCTQPKLASFLKSEGMGALFARSFQKQWIISNALRPFITGSLADGAGDAAFT